MTVFLIEFSRALVHLSAWVHDFVSVWRNLISTECWLKTGFAVQFSWTEDVFIAFMAYIRIAGLQ